MKYKKEDMTSGSARWTMSKDFPTDHKAIKQKTEQQGKASK